MIKIVILHNQHQQHILAKADNVFASIDNNVLYAAINNNHCQNEFETKISFNISFSNKMDQQIFMKNITIIVIDMKQFCQISVIIMIFQV